MSDRLGGSARRFLSWAYKRPALFPALSDVSAWAVAIAVEALIGRASAPVVSGTFMAVVGACAMAVALQWALGLLFGPYRHRWRVSSFDEVLATGAAWAVTALALISLCWALARTRPAWALASWAVGQGALFALILIVASRVVWRRFWEMHRLPDPSRAKRTLVFGAGDGADHVIRLMLQDRDGRYLPVAMLDDHPSKQNRVIQGVRVKGTRNDLEKVARAEQATVLLVAVRSLELSVLQALTRQAQQLGMDVRVLPSTSDLVGSMNLSDLRPPTVEELLGRDPVEIDLDAVGKIITGRRVLITGAGGSIGSELSRLVDHFEPSELYLLDRDESALHALQLSIEGRALLESDRLIVADIRDRPRIFELFERLRPEVVFHAAALKHLTLLERHPDEGVKTNVLGTKNVLDASVAVGVERFVNISTDKAADPTSILGASKLAAERLTAQISDRTGDTFVSVRFGNVLGSRGSVLPTFLEQIRLDKPLTVTHPDVTRYFMTIPEAVRLVLQAAAIGQPGEVLVLDMGEPVRIADLAQQLVDVLKPGHPVVFTGLRPGEKLHEVLVGAGEEAQVREHPLVFHTEGDRSDPATSFSFYADDDAIARIRALIKASDDDPFAQHPADAVASNSPLIVTHTVTSSRETHGVTAAATQS